MIKGNKREIDEPTDCRICDVLTTMVYTMPRASEKHAEVVVPICDRCATAVSELNQTLPVLVEGGAIEMFTVNVDGGKFRCGCGCNVFHKPDRTQLSLYECNGCGNHYRGDE
jgi:hypothetical protein